MNRLKDTGRVNAIARDKGELLELQAKLYIKNSYALNRRNKIFSEENQ
jgi:hypothetical protein